MLPKQTEDVSLHELLLRHKRKQNLTKLYDKGKLPFHKTEIGRCSECGKGPRWIEERKGVNEDGTHWCIPAHFEPIELLSIDESILCRTCFCAHYHIGDVRDPHPPGNTHLTTPHSQGSYDGGRFTAGEW